VPFKSTKQKKYLAINKPNVYKKFKKEEQNMHSKKMVNRPMGGKVYKNIVKKPMGGKVYKNIVKKPMGGKVYKVDNSGQQMVAKQYGGKIDG